MKTYATGRKKHVTQKQKARRWKFASLVFGTTAIVLSIYIMGMAKGIDVSTGYPSLTRVLHIEEVEAKSLPESSVTSATPTRDEIIHEIIKQATEANVDVNTALRIAECESSFNPYAKNMQGSTAKGIYQFTDPTWKYIGAIGHQFSWQENIAQFMEWYPQHPSWWACQ